MKEKCKRVLALFLSVNLSLSLMVTGAAAQKLSTSTASEDDYWPQGMYDRIEQTVMNAAPEVMDAGGKYVYKTTDGTFDYAVKLTDYQPHKSIEEVFEPKLDEKGTRVGTILKKVEVDDWTWAIRAALQDVTEHGGGTVVIPAGTYITGAIRFRGDNTRIHLENGAHIEFIRNLQYGTNVRENPETELPPVTPADGQWDDWYPQERTRYECRDIYGFSPLFYAYGLKNIAITGAGNGGQNPVTGDGRPSTSAEDIDGNDYEEGYIEPEAGTAISYIDGKGDSEHMRTFTVTKLPLYAEDGKTVLIPEGTQMTFNLDETGGIVPASEGKSYRDWINAKLDAWAPETERRLPDLVPLDSELLSDAQKTTRNARRINQYRPTFMEPFRCDNILISDFYLRNSPFWEVHPTYCTNIHVTGLHINSHGRNNDGCDPDSSQYILIENCIFNTGDDCIAIKCGRDNDGYEPWNKPSTHMIVRNNLMKDGHGGMVCGSEIGGGVEWIFSHNNTYDSPNLYYGLRFKTNSSRGGYIRHIYMKDTTVKAVMSAFATVNFYYDNDSDTRVPTATDIYVSNCRSPEGGFTHAPKLGLIMAKAYGSAPLSGIHFKDCEFEGFAQSPSNKEHPNRPVTNLMCVTPNGIEFDNVKVDGEIYNPPAQTEKITKLIFTASDNPNEVRTVEKPEDIEEIIKESRAANGKNWDISIVAEINGFDYKGKHYTVGDTIENSTYEGPLDGAPRGSILELINGGTLYVDGKSPYIKDADKRYPYYRESGIPAYEAFVRVNTQQNVGTQENVRDWGTSTETQDAGPNFVVDLRTPGRVSSLGGNTYAIKLRENVNMGDEYKIREPILLSKVEVTLRNGLFTDDQDFVFYTATPMITKTEIDLNNNALVVTYDRKMYPDRVAELKALDISLAADGKSVKIASDGKWSSDGRSISYAMEGAAADAGKYYTVDAFDKTSTVLSYRGRAEVIESGFTDTQAHWAKKDIDMVVEKGLITGTGAKTFSPDLPASRATAWIALAHLAGVDTTGGTNEYEKAMAWCIEKNISDGANPEGNITREEFAAMLYRFEDSPEVKSGAKAFADSDKVSDWAEDAVNWCISEGIIFGRENNTIAPQANVTRAEMVAMIARLLNHTGE